MTGFSKTISVLASVALLSGCVTAHFEEPVGKFTSAMATANDAVRTYFTEMNTFERKVYLSHVLYHQGTLISEVDAAQKPTGFAPVFKAESIDARLNAISLLSAYGARLAALAGTDAPTRFEAGSNTLGTNLINLSGTFQKLSAAGQGDPTASKYIAPIATIVGVFGAMVLERKRDAALTKAVIEGAPAVDQVLDQLDRDLKIVIDPLVDTGSLQELADATNYYNQNQAKMSFEERAALLGEIDALAGKYQAAVTANPSDAIDGIRDAHAALVKYARSSKRPQDLSALIAAIDTFNKRLEPVVNAVQKMRS